MKILVTGGAGFIGSNVVKVILKNGGTVRILDNLSSGFKENLNPDAEFIKGDIRDATLVEELSKNVDAVIHLAASVGNTRAIENPIADSEINVLGTLNVLEAARKCGVPKVVFSSSAGIFGELKTLPIREDHPAEPDSPYGASKLAAEKHCLCYSRLYPNLSCVCLRYFNVYGVNQRYDAYGNVIPIFAKRILNGEPILIYGDGEQTRDFVNVHDVANANYLAATKPVSGAFNIGSGTRITIRDLAKLMCETLNRDASIQYTSPRKGDVRDSLADISAARQKLGFAPTVQIQHGIAEYLSWAQKYL